MYYGYLSKYNEEQIEQSYKEHIEASPIYPWFKMDFDKLLSIINRYEELKHIENNKYKEYP